MNSLIIEVVNDKYLVRYQVLKSLVNRKHTTKEGKVINRLEKHPCSCEVFIYKVLNERLLPTLSHCVLTKIFCTSSVKYGEMLYLGRGLSKCSDKDKFNKWLGIYYAVMNLELDTVLKEKIASEFWHLGKL